MHGRRFEMAGIAALLLASACEKTPEPAATAPPKTTSQAASDKTSPAAAPKPTAATPPAPSDLTWDTPKTWEKVENPSTMRKATYRIPKVAGDTEDAEMSVSQAGGSVEANVTRWTGQFEKAKDDATKRFEKKVGDFKVTVVEIHGTFAGSGMPGAPAAGPKPDYAMLAAIVETSTPHFFKITGPEKTVMAARADFDKMVDSFRAK